MWSGAVLTGGSSRRMGRDKALLAVDGRPLAVGVADALRAAGAGRVVAVGGDLAALARLGLDAVADDHPGEGPLGGILTALRRAATEVVVVLACDLPGADAAAVAAVVDGLHADPSAGVAWPELGGHAEVLHAAWRVPVAEPVLSAAFAAGERAPRRAAAGLRRVPVAGVAASAVRDADLPADLAAGPRRAAPRIPPATMG